MSLGERRLILAFASCLTACGAAGGHDPRPATGEATAAGSAEPNAASNAPEPDVLLPGVAYRAPALPTSVVSLELAMEDEELSFELAAPEAEIEEEIDGMREVFVAMTGDGGQVRPIMLGAQQGILLTVVGQERGRVIGGAFAIAPSGDGRHARLSYQIRDQADPGASLERVLASFSRERRAAPADGESQVVGVAGYFLEAPTRLLIGSASHMFEDESELVVRTLPRSTRPDDGPLAASIRSSPGTARSVSHVERRDVTAAGAPGVAATYFVSMNGEDEHFTEQVAEVPLDDQLMLFVRAARMPADFDFDAFLASIQRTVPR